MKNFDAKYNMNFDAKYNMKNFDAKYNMKNFDAKYNMKNFDAKYNMKNFDATSKKFSWPYPSGHRLLHSPSVVAVGLSVRIRHGLKLAGITLL